MAGFYNSLKFDSCVNDQQTMQYQKINDYQMDLTANYRTGQRPAYPLAHASNPTFWGPLTGSLVTQESFLQGRGQTLANCPDCDVIWLPESLFPTQTQHTQPRSCQATDLEPLYTRMKRSCNSVSETDMTEYWMMPGAFQAGYSGPDSGIGSNLQTRMAPYDSSLLAGAGSETYGCASNYGTFGSGRNLQPYAL